MAFLWSFPGAFGAEPRPGWQIESKEARAALPEYKTSPAATAAELTTSDGSLQAEKFRTWSRSLGANGSQRYSALKQINRENVKNLEIAWVYHSGDGPGNIQCNPIVVGDLMICPTAGDQLVAIRSATGAEVWRFKPEGKPAFRGLTSHRLGGEEIVFFPSENNWLYALHARTGKVLSTFGEQGRTRLPEGSRVAPVIWQNLIITAGYNKDVHAFDLQTGKLAWTSHTIPAKGEFGHDTWQGIEAGANCWGGIALDEQRGIIFVTTGSPKPNFLGNRHHGDNLFSDCLIALEARSGKRLWHFQEIRHDIWDLDIPAPPLLLSITREGRKVDVVAAVTKLGNTLLLDRTSGRPIFPFRLRRAPTSTLPGEVTSPYQPAVQLPEPFARQEFTISDITDRTPEAQEFVLNRVKGANFGWFRPFTVGRPTILYGVHGGAEWTGACADLETGHLFVSANELPWMITAFIDDEPAFSPSAKPTEGELVFRKSCAQCHGIDRIGVGTAPPLRGLRHRLKDDEIRALLKTGRNSMPAAPPMDAREEQALIDFLLLRDRPAPAVNPLDPPRYSHNGYPKLLDHENYPGCKPPWGTLNCIDLNSGKLLWKKPLGEYPELTAAGMKPTGTENFGGPIVTAGGLVFCAGTRDLKIRAFDKDNGEELWSAKLPWGGFAPPATYEVNGRQFVVIAASGGGKLGGAMGDAYVAFALPIKPSP